MTTESRHLSLESKKIVAVFALSFLVVNGALLGIHRRDERRQIEQIENAVRGPILSGDPATAEEFLSSLTPHFVRRYAVLLDTDASRAPTQGGWLTRPMTIWFDEQKSVPAATVFLELQGSAFMATLALTNGLLVGLLYLGLAMARRYAAALLQFQVDFFSYLLGKLDAAIDAPESGALPLPHRPPEFPRQLEGVRDEIGKLEKVVDIHVSKQAELKNRAAIAGLAAQVTHDIRSPVAALRQSLGALGDIPSDQSRLIYGALTRIDDIASDLLKRYRTAPPTAESVSLRDLVWGLVEEFRSRLGPRSRIAITFLPVAGGGGFCRLYRSDLSRCVSNLMANAAEALGEDGEISVALDEDLDWVRLSVKDTGPGIPRDILPKLGQRGATFGKEGGTGLGLWHAKTTVESWGGRLEIESEVGKGTTVRLILPRVEAPVSSESAVILDDDPLVRMNWMVAAKRAGKTLKAYADPGALIKEADSIPKDTPIYIDSDLGNGLKGEDTAKELAALGFTVLHLATGHDSASFPHLPHIKSIRGKAPPWAAT